MSFIDVNETITCDDRRWDSLIRLMYTKRLTNMDITMKNGTTLLVFDKLVATHAIRSSGIKQLTIQHPITNNVEHTLYVDTIYSITIRLLTAEQINKLKDKQAQETPAMTHPYITGPYKCVPYSREDSLEEFLNKWFETGYKLVTFYNKSAVFERMRKDG